MADKNLILGARMAAGSFNTGLSDVVDRSISRAVGNITGALEAQAKYQQEIDRRAFDIINKFPPDINFSKVDGVHVEQLQAWAGEQKNNYYDLARQLAGMRVGSNEFMETQSKLNTIKGAYINANDNLINLQAKRAEWTQNRQSISKGVHNENIPMAAFDKLLLPEAEYTMSYDDFGNPTYVVSVDNKEYSITDKDLNWYQKDDEFALYSSKTAKDADTLGMSGVQITPESYHYNSLKNSLSLTLDQGGEERYKSILSDDLFDGIPLDFTAEEKAEYMKDPISAKEAIMDKMLKHFMNVNQIGYNNYLKAQEAKGTDSPFTAGDQFNLLAYQGTYNDALNFINANPNAGQVKDLLVRTNVENAGKYSTGKELNNIIDGMSKSELNKAGYSEEDRFDENKLFYMGDDSPTLINLNDEAIFDIYMDSYGAPPNVTALFKNNITFTNKSNLGGNPSINNNNLPNINMKDIMSNKPSGQIPTIDRSEIGNTKELTPGYFQNLLNNMNNEGGVNVNRL
jgi:hypothetical protein